MAISRAQSAVADGANPTATFGSTPTSGSVLVATAFSRSGTSESSHTIDGTGWAKRVAKDNELGDAQQRCSLSVWTKIAGASEATAIQVSGDTVRLVIEEFAGDASEEFTFGEAVNNSLDEAQPGAATYTSLATPSTSSLTGDNLLIAVHGGRQQASPVSAGDWTGDVSANELDSGGNVANGRHITNGFATTGVSGTKTATINAPDDSWTGGVAGLIVFSYTTGTPAAVVRSRLVALGIG